MLRLLIALGAALLFRQLLSTQMVDLGGRVVYGQGLARAGAVALLAGLMIGWIAALVEALSVLLEGLAAAALSLWRRLRRNEPGRR